MSELNYMVVKTVKSSSTFCGICGCQKRKIHPHQHAVQLSAIEENERYG